MVKAKKYFYVLRPILACRWIMDRNCPPPMLFSELVESQMERELVPVVEELLDVKMNAPETKMIPRIDVLNDFIGRNLVSLELEIAAIKDVKDHQWARLDNMFLAALRIWD